MGKPMIRKLSIAALLLLMPALATAKTLKVVATLPAYASIAEEIGGANVEVSAISLPDEDAHFVKPKPSFALELKSADLFITTGLDLELWAPVLVDRSGNRSIRDGQPGFVSASQGVPLLDVPSSLDRSAGDVHLYGNPHIFTSPLNAKIIAANIAAGLGRVDPANKATWDANLAAFQRKMDETVFGADLVALLGGDTLDGLARQGKLISFLESQQYEGKPLSERLGGWMKNALPLRGARIVTYHKNWIYFTELFGIEVADYVEPKPGIPPSAKHVFELVEKIKSEHIPALFAASYFSSEQVAAIAQRTGCAAVQVPLGPGTGGSNDYFTLVDRWIDGLLAAVAG